LSGHPRGIETRTAGGNPSLECTTGFLKLKTWTTSPLHRTAHRSKETEDLLYRSNLNRSASGSLALLLGWGALAMFILKHGRSYVWLFAVFLALFLGGNVLCELVGHAGWGIITMPAFITLLVLCELWSGVALDSWWRASYLKGSRQYQAMLIWHSIGIIFFILIFIVFIYI
jgi:hypothetical protein